MVESRYGRIALLALLLLVLFGGLVWHGTLEPNPQDGRYPSASDSADRPNDYVDQQVAVSGVVVETNPLVTETKYDVFVAGTYERRSVEYTIVSPPHTPKTGRKIQVFGTLTGERTIRASRITAYGANPGYMYAVSFLAGLWVLGRLLTQWRLEWSDLSIRRRETPIRISRTLHSQFDDGRTDASSRGGNDDA